MKIELKRTISAPASQLWAYLADFSNISRFHPLLKGSYFIEGTQHCDVGATRQCDFKDGHYLKERVTEWQEGSHYTVDIYDTSMPLERAHVTLGVRAINEHTSETYMHMNMEPKYTVLQPMMFMMFRFFSGPKILQGLEKLHSEEARPVAA